MTIPVRFTDLLRQQAAPIWEAEYAHPFVRGIGDGSLVPERFAFWVRQDYLFLIEYCRLFALAAARAPDLATMDRFAGLLTATITEEMALHRTYAAQFGTTPADLERESMAPTTRGYTDFLLRTATLGDFAELASALLPCMWGFSEIGLRLAETTAEHPLADRRYQSWIETYADPAFAELAAWCRELVDRLAGEASPAQRERMAQAFITSSQYELAFFEMGWTQQTWPH